jgi:hypothetical protein
MQSAEVRYRSITYVGGDKVDAAIGGNAVKTSREATHFFYADSWGQQ